MQTQQTTSPAARSSPVRLLRIGDVIDRVALCEREIENRVASGQFPRPVHLGPRSRRFVEHEVDDYLAGTIARSRSTPQSA